jgi:hypothetical protein
LLAPSLPFYLFTSQAHALVALPSLGSYLRPPLRLICTTGLHISSATIDVYSHYPSV